MNPKRIVCSNPWLAQFVTLVTIVGPKGDRFRSYAFVHNEEGPVETRQEQTSLHRLFG